MHDGIRETRYKYSNPNTIIMKDHIYKKVELTGTSKNSIEEAVQNAIHRSSETLKSMRWFEVTEIRGDIDEGSVNHWQVSLKLGFTLEEKTE
jgi:hypothetical protein